MVEETGAKPVRRRRAARSGGRPFPHMRSRRAVGLYGLQHRGVLHHAGQGQHLRAGRGAPLVLVGYQGPNRYRAPASRPLGGAISPPKGPRDFRSPDARALTRALLATEDGSRSDEKKGRWSLMSTPFNPERDDARKEPRIPPCPRSVNEDSSKTIASRSRRSPLKFFLLVFALSIPFSLIGAVTGLQLYPGIPVTALAFVCPATAAAILSYRENGTAAVTTLLKRSFDYKRIGAKVWCGVNLI